LAAGNGRAGVLPSRGIAVSTWPYSCSESNVERRGMYMQTVDAVRLAKAAHLVVQHRVYHARLPIDGVGVVDEAVECVGVAAGRWCQFPWK